MKGTRATTAKSSSASVKTADRTQSDPVVAKTEKLQAAEEAKSFPIVGIGASAGGLEAFIELLKALPATTGMAFVLVQHLDPSHESALTELLAKVSSMPVNQAGNDMAVERNHVYVIPPNTDMGISEGRLRLQPRGGSPAPHHSIDFFFESLAQAQQERAIGVVLSGTATDGTMGLEAIKAEGGITFAQDSSAKYDSMPRSAIAAQCVDFTLSARGIAEELVRLAKHPYVANAPGLKSDGKAKKPVPAFGKRGGNQLLLRTPDQLSSEDDKHYEKILLLLRKDCGVDFSFYKSTTILRRIHRRMVLNRQNSLEQYVLFLRENPKELSALYTDLLIGVTSFFRNPELFETLKEVVFPRLCQGDRDPTLRFWVLGCSTGQEVYSLAMAFTEFAENAAHAPQFQIFATDLNETAVEFARRGLYDKSLLERVSPERLGRFFVEEARGYRISKALRERCVFARHNVIGDPPFSRLDLISCRNLMIYLDPEPQKKIIPTFHYALKPEGFLILGASESVGSFPHLFEPVDKKQKVFARTSGSPPLFHPPATRNRPIEKRMYSNLKADIPREAAETELSAQREADRLAASRFVPPSVLIDAEFQIIQFRGQTGTYLNPPTGKPVFDLLKMAREDLVPPLRVAVNRARKENKTMRQEGVRFKENGNDCTVAIEVIPLKNLKRRCYLVLFDAGQAASPKALPVEGGLSPAKSGQSGRREAKAGQQSRRRAELEQELTETREYLQSLQEQYEAATADQQAAGEELQSANEELQSINEELETSKEELESSNEELTTINEEMVSRNEQLNRLISDLKNLHVSIHTAILVLNRDLNIRHFTPEAEAMFNLLATDAGRPLGSVRHNLDCPDLEAVVREVIDTVSVREREIQDKAGRWYSLRIRPYLTLDNKIDGAVVMLVDVNALKRSEQEVKKAHEYVQAIVENVPPLLVLDEELRVEMANDAFCRHFQVSPTETEGSLIYDLGNGQWNIPELRRLLDEILPGNTAVKNFEVSHKFPHLGPRIMLLDACRLDHLRKIILCIQDATDQKKTESQLESFVYSIAHDLRSPLRAMQGFANMLVTEHGPAMNEEGREFAARIEASARFMDHLLSDLLAFAKIGSQTIDLGPVDLRQLVEEVVARHQMEIQDKHSKIEIVGPLPKVRAHASTLGQVITNLLSNALKFVAPGVSPQVRLWAEVRGATVILSVEDNGIGITQENANKLFQIFRRLHTTSSYPGTGIGLAIVQKGVERMGGSVGVQSTPGKGSRFWIELPTI
ncbi:chemotaxis protein CheB [Pedosphaera parvula]|uniref:histidine kinase n=1 Tax=Pedosphaera parvula (strain Ellin514) TaxID=320771 RepID=B9XES5_PEDPL|nr:chemotaxis protein CheB [Pedosphaera parvula]EEF61789.1 signal transduction histidine kinase with CheB and CheR activity [Pedosphaera parvula Ellin514]